MARPSAWILARQALKKEEGEAVEKRHKRLNKPRRAPLFTDYVDDYYAPTLRRSKMKAKPREVEVRRVTEGTVGSYFHKYRIDEIHRTLIEGFIDARLHQGAGAAGINRDLARLRHLLNDAGDRPELLEELGIELSRIPWRRLRMEEQPQS